MRCRPSWRSPGCGPSRKGRNPAPQGRAVRTQGVRRTRARGKVFVVCSDQEKCASWCELPCCVVLGACFHSKRQQVAKSFEYRSNGQYEMQWHTVISSPFTPTLKISEVAGRVRITNKPYIFSLKPQVKALGEPLPEFHDTDNHVKQLSGTPPTDFLSS